MKKFIDYSKNIGQDFMLCQGPGGNTSFKVDNTVYIKKSGLHLSKATKDTFKNRIFKILNFYQSSKNDMKNLIKNYQLKLLCMYCLPQVIFFITIVLHLLFVLAIFKKTHSINYF